MNNLKGLRARKFTAAALALLTLMVILAPQKLSADECEKALIKCAIDAGIPFVMGLIASLISINIIPFLIGTVSSEAYLSFCLNGYLFCLIYYKAA